MKLRHWTDFLKGKQRPRRRAARLRRYAERLEDRTLLASGSALCISGFTLIDADDDEPLGALADGDVINLRTLPTGDLSLRADLAAGNVGSVQFGFDSDDTFRTENVAPYALFGDNSGNYFDGEFSLGTHTVTATAYSSSGARGSSGEPVSITFTVVDQDPNPLPDLKGQTFDISPQTAPAGSAIDVDFSVENSGVADAGAYRVDFYLSANSTIETSDLYLGGRALGGLNAGDQTATLSESFTLPLTGDDFWSGDGTYYLGMLVDAGGEIEESNEANNANRGNGLDRDAFSVTQTAPAVDLRGNWFAASSDSAEAGSEINVEFGVENIEFSAAGEFRVDFYLSSDGNISTTDHLLGSREFSGLNGNEQTATLSESFTLPATGDTFWSGDGTYYLGMLVDGGDAVAEQDEANNGNRGNGLDRDVLTITDTRLPVDLRGSLFAVDTSTATAGESVEVDFRVENLAAGEADDFRVDFYLSTDATISTADSRLDTRTVSGLSGNSETGTLTASLTLPPAGDDLWSDDGEYHLGAIVDAADEIDELDETNNRNLGLGLDSAIITVTETEAVDPLAILRFTLIDADNNQPLRTISNGDVINLALLSTDEFNIRAEPVAGNVGSVRFGFDGDSNSQTENVAPYALFGDNSGNYNSEELPLGTHTLTATAYSSSGARGNSGPPRTIQFEVIDVPPPPDLLGDAFEVSAGTVAPGTLVDVDFRVSNVAPGQPQDFRVDFYISRDETISPADRLLGSRIVAGDALSNETGLLMETLSLPAVGDAFWTDDGTYYLGMIVDAGSAVDEADETNNANRGAGLDRQAIFVSFTPAFPGAEGYAATATGGRGGRVIEVTNRNDSGPGSLRAAVEADGPRIVVFKVGGTITLESQLEISNPDITIAGQTAPGDGITLRFAGPNRHLLSVRTDNVIVRYLRLRRGEAGANGDSLHIHDDSSLVLIDHVSITWGTDENLDIYSFTGGAIRDVTVQNSLIGQALDTGAGHALGALISGLKDPEYWRLVSRIDLHHNVMADNTHRNPRVVTQGTKIVNNVSYNWLSRAGSTERDTLIDWIGNHFIRGPMSSSDDERLLFHATTDPSQTETFDDASIYIEGNIAPDFGFVDPTQDNWGMLRDHYVKEDGRRVELPLRLRRDTPLPDPHVPISTDEAGEPSKDALLADVGANRRLNADGTWSDSRDPIDQEIVDNVANGTGPTANSLPSTAAEAANGYQPTDTNGGYTDADRDGMADVWETLYNFNPNDPADGAADRDGDGWTNVEEFLNGTHPGMTG